MTASGVLLNWKRPYNIPRIVHGMLSVPFISEVIIWNNNPEADIEWASHVPERGRVRVIHAGKNYFTWGRFKAAKIAKHEMIFTCDDDVLVTDWEKLKQAHDMTQRIVSYLPHNHYNRAPQMYRHEYGSAVCYETLLGYGSVFKKSMVSVFNRFTELTPRDELFYRKADRFFTMLQQDRHVLLESDVHHLPGATDREIALYRQPGHWELNKRAYERVGEYFHALNSEAT